MEKRPRGDRTPALGDHEGNGPRSEVGRKQTVRAHHPLWAKSHRRYGSAAFAGTRGKLFGLPAGGVIWAPISKEIREPGVSSIVPVSDFQR